ncbi:MAG TPA: restriction endonuclease subunit S, partial [Acholeplasmataceae bacterium]|nr:restriction endonuclease subunit S [Acholeplasmataceae bacterium]
VLLSDKGYANKCIAEILNMIAWKYVSHVGNPKLMNNVMSEIEVVVPTNMIEQESISKLLSKIDNLITLHQRKYEKQL